MCSETPTPVIAPRRRWLQFSLRTLLIVISLFAGWLAVQVNRAHRSQAAIAAIRQFGGQVQYDYETGADGLPVKNALPPGPAWLRNLIGVEYFANVKAVEFRRDATDAN